MKGSAKQASARAEFLAVSAVNSYTVGMIYFAHRGASASAVQNTVSAFEAARRFGATCYELDVHLTKDGVLAVHHDYDLPWGGVISDYTFEELRSRALPNPFGPASCFIPRLEEVLPLLHPGLELVNIELKNDGNRYPGIERKLEETLCGCFADILPKILFSSFDYETLGRIRKLDKTARIGLLTRSFDVSKALALNAESVHINQTRFTPQTARICHENELKVYLYTVNERETARKWEETGADGIFTDRIELFLAR